MTTRSKLRALLGTESVIKPSYRPHRLGFVITTVRPSHWLRALVPRWAERVVPIHTSAGRYYLAPSKAYLSRALSSIPLTQILEHQNDAVLKSDFFSPQRCERLRRLPALFEPESRQGRGAIPSRFRPLILRLEGLPHAPKPQRQWAALSQDFDELWTKVSLHTCPLNSLQRQTLHFLWQCWRVWGDESGDHGE